VAFTIKGVDDQGGVTVSFDIDNVDQHISGLPVDDASALAAALSAYEAAYAAGLRMAAPRTVHDDVKAMVGKTH